MPNSEHKLLALTALENTWGETEPLLFLGEWCKLYERRLVWEERHHDVVPFHWDDRVKLAKDYDYLEVLHHQLLHCLTESLNELHGVSHSVRYWQILLDPWLLSYVGVLFDRWENLRIAFEAHEQVDLVYLNDASITPPFSYNEFINEILTDEWNQALYQRIVEDYYLDKCSLQKKSMLVTKVSDVLIEEKRSGLGRLLLRFDRGLGRVFPKVNALFFMSNFNLLALTRLNSALGQVPRLFLDEFKLPLVEYDLSKRTTLKLRFQPHSTFETFIHTYITKDIPTCVIEGYQSICTGVKRIPIKTKVMITASAHWNNPVYKFWMAEQINQGTQLVTLEHGGSFPAIKELFDFEEDIADVKGTWFVPYHEKHVQVPPSKLIHRYARKRVSGEYGTIIGNESSRWVFRCHFYPMGAQCLHSLTLMTQLYESVNEQVKQCIRVKAYSNQGINTNKRYADRFGADKILLDEKIDTVFSLSKVIICTYPETTFSEAMASGVPTIMVYPEELYERHPSTRSLLDKLRLANIVFHDGMLAAKHLNSIWSNPKQWWERPDVLLVRAAFKEHALKLDNNWLKNWAFFINETIEAEET